MPLRENYTNGEVMDTNHPSAHNVANDLINTHTDSLAAIFTALGTTNSNVAAAQTDANTIQFNVAAAGVGYIVHNANANSQRPNRGFGIYIWFGTVQPNNWASGDIYVDISP